MFVFFDLDGVILDTEPQYTRFWEQFGREFFPDQPDFPQLVKGNTLRHIFDTWFPNDTAAQERLRKRLREHETQMIYPYLPGAVRLMTELRDAGHHTAIVTSSSRPKMSFVLRHHPELPTLVEHIFTAEDAPHSKPAPDCYLHAAEYYHADPASCIVIEDSENGLRAARDAGMRVVGLLTTTDATIVAPLADKVANDLNEVDIPFLEKLISR